MGLLSWVIFGALVGWIAARLAGTDNQQGCVITTALGVLGALLGGTAYGFLQGEDITLGWNIGSLAIAVIGAMVVSWGYAYFTRGGR